MLQWSQKFGILGWERASTHVRTQWRPWQAQDSGVATLVGHAAPRYRPPWVRAVGRRRSSGEEVGGGEMEERARGDEKGGSDRYHAQPPTISNPWLPFPTPRRDEQPATLGRIIIYFPFISFSELQSYLSLSLFRLLPFCFVCRCHDSCFSFVQETVFRLSVTLSRSRD